LAFGQQWFTTGLSTRDLVLTTIRELQQTQPVTPPPAVVPAPQPQPGTATGTQP
jgi:hypothetical protein